MGFKIRCPNCGWRNVYEFSFESEERRAPGAAADLKAWRDYLYFRENACGPQAEWWVHSGGCGAWLRIRRDTSTNEILEE
jgi:sarcosine oxidase subunit delta